MQLTLRADEVPEHLKEFFEPVGDSGIAPKNLLMIPAMFAIAARADGWYLRSAIVWAKGVSFDPDYSGSVMPGSQKDRPTSAYENIFLLAKRPVYYYDNEAIKENAVSSAKGTRTPRNVWQCTTEGFSGAHFACWPERLVEPMVKAGTSERGACPQCGKPWVRVTEDTGERVQQHWKPASQQAIYNENGHAEKLSANSVLDSGFQRVMQTVGWQPSCTCPPHEPVPCVVLDPFSGSGTTAKVAVRLGRRAIGVDVSAEYLDTVTAERFGGGVQMELAV